MVAMLHLAPGIVFIMAQAAGARARDCLVSDLEVRLYWLIYLFSKRDN